jgi:hypothetical protein
MKKIFTFLFVALMSANMYATDPVKLWVNFPTANRPAATNIEVAGTFTEGTMWMEELFTGWFTNSDFFHANADDTFKFRDKDDTYMVLCKFNTENNRWEQAIFKVGDVTIDSSYKGTPCKYNDELDLSDANMYAWVSGAPEPSSIKNVTVSATKTVKVVRNGKILILKNGKTYNALGAEVK